MRALKASPFFGNGLIKLTFHFFGKIPESIEELKISNKGSIKQFEHFEINSAGILSGPGPNYFISLIVLLKTSPFILSSSTAGHFYRVFDSLQLLN